LTGGREKIVQRIASFDAEKKMEGEEKIPQFAGGNSVLRCAKEQGAIIGEAANIVQSPEKGGGRETGAWKSRNFNSLSRLAPIMQKA